MLVMLNRLRLSKHMLPAQLASQHRLAVNARMAHAKAKVCIGALHHMWWAVLTGPLLDTTYRCSSSLVTRAIARCLRIITIFNIRNIVGERAR